MLLFQSSPSPKAGSYTILATNPTAITLFQSSPSPKAGSYILLKRLIREQTRFNPLPARRPGATANPDERDDILAVSILSQPEGRELRYMGFASVVIVPVSILSQPEGRELLDKLAQEREV